jgi:DNA repair exonuclease SbcCD nuclease subunit
MLSFVAKLEKVLKVDSVVWAGDIFHHKQPSRTSHATVLKLMKVAQQYDNLWVVTGNHDITSDRLDSLEKQPLGVLYEAGVLKELDGWHPSLPIFGVPWQQRWLSPGTIDEAFKEFRDHGFQSDFPNDHALVVTHAPIYPPTVADNVLFELLNLEEVADAMGNSGSLYYGHIHEPHYTFEVGGVKFANMGAISRGSLHEYNLARKIQVAIWTPEHGFNPIDIPHKPASEVFKLAEAHEKKEVKMDLDSFLAEVGSATLDISSTGSIIEHVRSMNIEEPVKNTSIELLEEVTN